MNLGAERISSISRDEFRNHLPLALRGLEYTWMESDRVVVTLAGGTAEISVEPLAPLSLSDSLALPRCRIRIGFSGCAEAERAAFLQRYDRAFQRGGG